MILFGTFLVIMLNITENVLEGNPGLFKQKTTHTHTFR